jgi:SAM-dependent methyltransferase
MVESIVAASPGPGVLDVGCGTGIAARQFQAAGCRVLGVEPDARMAGVARRFGVEAEVATFEAWDGGGRAFDAVVAGQAWHWVDPVAGAVKAAQVLRPGGRLAVFWNSFRPPADVGEAFAMVHRRVVPTFGGFSKIRLARQEELLAGVGAAIDAVGGSFTMGYTAVVATAVRT